MEFHEILLQNTEILPDPTVQGLQPRLMQFLRTDFRDRCVHRSTKFLPTLNPHMPAITKVILLLSIENSTKIALCLKQIGRAHV